jgi:hypothetical protein
LHLPAQRIHYLHFPLDFNWFGLVVVRRGRMAASEAHLQGIARFLVGFGTEEDDKWRDYHFDFCGTIEYDPKTGDPIRVSPVENSGYSLGCLQLDFGQTTAAAEPFITAFESWHATAPGSLGLASARQSAIDALKSDGKKLIASPTSALKLQDVEALSAYVLSPAGSEWVNSNVDNALIGSDAQQRSKYSAEFTLVGVARQVETTQAFKKADAADRTDMTDLMYAMTMKAYNQAPGNCLNKLLPFLNTSPTDDDIASWPDKFTGAFREGVSNAIQLSQVWTKLKSGIAGQKPPAWLLSLQDVMDAKGLANPRTESASSGAYVAARQIFESSGYFPGFASAIVTGRNFIPKALFDPATGAIKIVSTTKRVTQGVMVRDKIGYVWDTAGDAYQLTNGGWMPTDIKKINGKLSMFETIRDMIKGMFVSS